MLNKHTLLTASVATAGLGALEVVVAASDQDLGTYTFGCLGVLCAMHAASLLLG